MSTNKPAKFLYGLLLITGLLLAACSTATTSPTRLSLSSTGLEPLAGGFHYEGWLIIDGAPVTTGKFNVDADGNLVDLTGNVITDGAFDVADNAEDASNVVISIEPNGDTDTIPSNTKYLAGELTDGKATLSIAAPQALGSDFSAATGSYIIATPTSASTDDENSGVWFLDPSSGSPEAGLNLPTLPEGWAYEGWAVIGGTPVSTGTFTDVAASDSFSGFSGSLASPPFPGEDFLKNAPQGLSFPTNLADATMVISVEPSPDDSTAPFALKPLVGSVPSTIQNGTPYTLDNNAAGAASITASLK